jgi:hypothetical protein
VELSTKKLAAAAGKTIPTATEALAKLKSAWDKNVEE